MPPGLGKTFFRKEGGSELIRWHGHGGEGRWYMEPQTPSYEAYFAPSFDESVDESCLPCTGWIMVSGSFSRPRPGCLPVPTVEAAPAPAAAAPPPADATAAAPEVDNAKIHQ